MGEVSGVVLTMETFYSIRNWLIRKLAGKSTIVLNADIDMIAKELRVLGRAGAIVCDSRFTECSIPEAYQTGWVSGCKFKRSILDRILHKRTNGIRT